MTTPRRWVVVLDDDPTGSQTVHDVEVVTDLDPTTIARALTADAPACFLLTNSRSLPEADAVALNHRVAAVVFDVAARNGAEVDLVSRSDSTLRGHVIAEPAALDATRRDSLGAGFDAVLLAPAYFEAGRVTDGDVQWVTTGDERVPAAETEFARDATFGYSSSDLRALLSERSAGAVAASGVLSIGRDLVEAGPDAVAGLLKQVRDATWVVVNATSYADYDVVVAGVRIAQAAGRSFLFRTGPSFVRPLAGLAPRPPLIARDLWPAGRPRGHGLVVVGSHTERTTRQLERVQARYHFAETMIDVDAVVDATDSERLSYLDDTARTASEALTVSNTLIATTRTRRTGVDAEDSLRIARLVSAAVSSVVAGTLPAGPAWVVAKGGITSHDVATDGLGIRRATVLGQLGPGIISVFQPIEAAPDAMGIPYVVFPGNVGGDDTLADVVATLAG